MNTNTPAGSSNVLTGGDRYSPTGTKNILTDNARGRADVKYQENGEV